MPASDRQQARRRFPVFVPLVLVFSAVLAFVPNPATDRLLSAFCSHVSGRPVALQHARYEFPSTITFARAQVWPLAGSGAVLVKNGRLTYLRSKGRGFFTAEEIDLRPLWADKVSAAGHFVKRHDLADWLVVKRSRWALTGSGSSFRLKLLDASAGEGALRGGLGLEAGGLSKVDAALWLPPALWKRFPDLIEKRFAQDGQGRRLFKLTWKEGLWRLWGRSGPVLEARWQ